MPNGVVFVMEEVAVEQVSLQVIWVLFVSIIPPALCARSFIRHWLCILSAVDSVMQ
jgi:hypothetical protein